jgi:hypothetical protein
LDDSGFIEWVAGHQRQLLRSAYLLTGDLSLVSTGGSNISLVGVARDFVNE